MAQFEQIHETGVILQDFSPAEPALSEFEEISRVRTIACQDAYPLRARSFASSG